MSAIGVLVVTTHRSDRGHYAPLVKLLRSDSRFVVYFNDVLDEQMFREYRPDVGIALGDRVEMLQWAIKVVDARIPLVHIHGGEHTYGSLDERWRWGISAIADVHCVATDEALTELSDILNILQGTEDAGQMSAPNDTVYLTGAPGLDGITERQPWEKHDHFEDEVLVLYNPAIDEATTIREWTAIAEAVNGMHCHYFWIKPNGDRFSDVIGATAKNSMGELDSERFRDLLAHVRVIVGNSSAGIIEAPSLGTWTVNVGRRQEGRPRAGSITDVPTDPAVIRYQIKAALANPLTAPWYPNPYGDGHASERIRDVLLGMEMGK